MYPRPHTHTPTHTNKVSHLSFPRPSSPSPALCETPSSFFSLSPNQKKRQCLSLPPVFCSACVCGCVRAHPHTHARSHRRRLPCAAVMALSCQNIPAFTHYLAPKQPGSVCLCAGSQGRLSTFSSLSFISLPTLSPSFSSFVIFSPPPFPQYFSLSSLFFHFCLILSFCFSLLLNVFLPFFRFLLVERRVESMKPKEICLQLCGVFTFTQPKMAL